MHFIRIIQFFLPQNMSHTCLYSQQQIIATHWLVLIVPTVEGCGGMARLSTPRYCLRT